MTFFILPEPGMAGLAFLREHISNGAALLCHDSDRNTARDRFPGCAIATYPGGSLTPSRDDLFALAADLDITSGVVLVRDEERAWGWDAYVTALGLMEAGQVTILSQKGSTSVHPPYTPHVDTAKSLLLIACGGIGNIIQATPLLAAAVEMGLTTTFCPVADGSGDSLASLFKDALPGLEVVAPDKIAGLNADIRLNIEYRAHMVETEFFHSPYRESMTMSEPVAYARFFENVTGQTVDPTTTFVGGNSVIPDSLKGRIVLCPGSKPGWDSKRWPHFGELAERLDNPVVLCREADLNAYDELDFLKPMRPDNASIVTEASLPEAAAILRHAKGVIANDCGLAHMAAATKVPTLVLFGPSSLDKNRPLRSNAKSLSLCLDCQPCQGETSGPGRLGPGDYSCRLGYQCLNELTVEQVLSEADTFFNATTKVLT